MCEYASAECGVVGTNVIDACAAIRNSLTESIPNPYARHTLHNRRAQVTVALFDTVVTPSA
jgi:hypothetical protein